jgi:hypothetical protein
MRTSTPTYLRYFGTYFIYLPLGKALLAIVTPVTFISVPGSNHWHRDDSNVLFQVLLTKESYICNQNFVFCSKMSARALIMTSSR